MAQQTAVEWLAKELESYGDPQVCDITWKDLDSLVEQAKQMEKEQVSKAFEEGIEEGYSRLAMQQENLHEIWKDPPKAKVQ